MACTIQEQGQYGASDSKQKVEDITKSYQR